MSLINAQVGEVIDINALANKTADLGVLAYHENKVARVLLDSGALGRNFVTTAYCNLNKLSLKTLSYNIRIKSIHGNETANHGIELPSLTVEADGEKVIIPKIQLIVLKDGPADIDIILGLETLRENNVFGKLSRYFGTGINAKGSLITSPEDRAVGSGSGHERWPARKPDRTSIDALSTAGTPNLRYHTMHISEVIPNAVLDDDTDYLLPAEMYVPSATHDPEGCARSTSDGIQNETEADVGYQQEHFSFNVKGTEADKIKLLAVLENYRDIFSSTLRGTPASVTPMEIHVDYDAYKADRRSREPTRAQSAARKAAITAWIRQAIADNVIKPSTATAWAQLMLTKKPNGSWRFAIDYRAVNKFTKPMRAPIPNIKKLLHQLGGQRPKRFAKCDFTSGFYQTPIRGEDTQYTAFTCDDGLFEFNVASMGLINSPWYFQRIM